VEQREYKTPEHIREKNRRWREKNREQILERERAYYQEHREERQASKRASQAKHREAKLLRDHLYGLKRRDVVRQAILGLLGTKCAKCGFADVRALQIDHINGNGTQERQKARSMDAYYRNILAVKGEGYQMLCANCNQIKRYEENESSRLYFP
jgi:hypothetical protein